MNNIIKNIISAIAFILIQCLILNNINFLNSINPLLYIYIIVYFPIINNRIIFILFSFLYGLSIDIFTDSAAVHAVACVSLAYFRPIFLKLILYSATENLFCESYQPKYSYQRSNQFFTRRRHYRQARYLLESC